VRDEKGRVVAVVLLVRLLRHYRHGLLTPLDRVHLCGTQGDRLARTPANFRGWPRLKVALSVFWRWQGVLAEQTVEASGRLLSTSCLHGSA
jgi:hypothetical protein